MEYTLMFYLSPEEFAARSDPEKSREFYAAFMPYVKAIREAGVFVSGAGLQPPAASTTLRLKNGQRLAQTVERVVRDSYGRLLAFLAARSRDVASAEDALADSFAKALETWPETGVPQNPEAWLLVAARRKLADRARHARVGQDKEPALSEALEEAGRLVEQRRGLPDERLQMLFLCSHPAIDESVRTALIGGPGI